MNGEGEIMVKNNKRKLELDDELKMMFADLKASIEKVCRGNYTHKDQHMPKVYKVVSRGGDEWER